MLVSYPKEKDTKKDAHLECFMTEKFPTLQAEMRAQATRARRLGAYPARPQAKKANVKKAKIVDGAEKIKGTEANAVKKKRGRPHKSVTKSNVDGKTPAVSSRGQRMGSRGQKRTRQASGRLPLRQRKSGGARASTLKL